MLFSNLLRSKLILLQRDYNSYVHNGAVLDFYYELGLKEIQSVLRSRHCLGTYMWLLSVLKPRH